MLIPLRSLTQPAINPAPQFGLSRQSAGPEYGPGTKNVQGLNFVPVPCSRRSGHWQVTLAGHHGSCGCPAQQQLDMSRRQTPLLCTPPTTDHIRPANSHQPSPDRPDHRALHRTRGVIWRGKLQLAVRVRYVMYVPTHYCRHMWNGKAQHKMQLRNWVWLTPMQAYGNYLEGHNLVTPTFDRSCSGV